MKNTYNRKYFEKLLKTKDLNSIEEITLCIDSNLSPIDHLGIYLFSFKFLS